MIAEVMIWRATAEVGMVVNADRWWVTIHYVDCPRYRDRRIRHHTDPLPAGIPIRLCRRCRPFCGADLEAVAEEIAWKMAKQRGKGGD